MFTSRNHVSDDQQGRRPDACRGDARGEVGEGRGEGPLVGQGARGNERSGSLGRLAVTDQRTTEQPRRSCHSHINERVFPKLAPNAVQSSRCPAPSGCDSGSLMARGEGDRRGGVAMRDGYSCVGRHGGPTPGRHARARPGTALPRRAEMLGLFRAAAENVRVAAFQADDRSTRSRMFRNQLIDLRLRERAMADRLPRTGSFRPTLSARSRSRRSWRGGRRPRHPPGRQHLGPATGQQARITRPRARPDRRFRARCRSSGLRCRGAGSIGMSSIDQPQASVSSVGRSARCPARTAESLGTDSRTMLNGSWPGVRIALAMVMTRIAIFRFLREVVDREHADPLQEEHDEGRLEADPEDQRAGSRRSSSSRRAGAWAQRRARR